MVCWAAVMRIISSHFDFGFLYIKSLFLLPSLVFLPVLWLGLLSSVGYLLQIVVEILPPFSLGILNTQRSNSHIESLIIPQARKTWHEYKRSDSRQISSSPTPFDYNLLFEFSGQNTQLPQIRKLSFSACFGFSVV